MNLEVTVTGASLDDVVETVYDEYGDEVTGTTLGEVIAGKLVDRLTQDPRWEKLTGKLVASADKYVRDATPGFVEALVAQEVKKQLTVKAATAAVRGERSTAAEAMIATEVTAQLRAQFAPLVDAALMRLQAEMDQMARQAVTAFRKGAGG